MQSWEYTFLGKRFSTFPSQNRSINFSTEIVYGDAPADRTSSPWLAFRNSLLCSSLPLRQLSTTKGAQKL